MQGRMLVEPERTPSLRSDDTVDRQAIMRLQPLDRGLRLRSELAVGRDVQGFLQTSDPIPARCDRGRRRAGGLVGNVRGRFAAGSGGASGDTGAGGLRRPMNGPVVCGEERLLELTVPA